MLYKPQQVALTSPTTRSADSVNHQVHFQTCGLVTSDVQMTGLKISLNFENLSSLRMSDAGVGQSPYHGKLHTVIVSSTGYIETAPRNRVDQQYKISSSDHKCNDE